MTGAPSRPGADAVVMVERTRAGRRGRSSSWRPGVSPASTCARRGRTSPPARRSSPPAPCSAPATSGSWPASAVTPWSPFPRPRVGVLSTGDELVEGAGALRPGQIRDSNRPHPAGPARPRAAVVPVDLGDRPRRRGGDHRGHRRARCRAATPCSPAAGSAWATSTTSRSSSTGCRAGTMRWMQVAIRPAKPFAFGLVEGHAGVRASRQPGVVDGQLRAVRPARPAADDGPPGRSTASASQAVADDGLRRRPRRQAAPAPGGGHAPARTAGSTSAPPAVRAPTSCSAMALANALALVPTGRAWRPGRRSTTWLLGRAVRRLVRPRPSAAARRPAATGRDLGAGERARPAAGRPLRADRARPADLGHRPLQLPLHLLHARGGHEWLPATSC